MISKLEIAGVHMSVGDDLKKHVLAKIGQLDTYMPRHARTSVHVEVKLKAGKAKAKKDEHTCEVILHLPNEVITVSDTSESIFTAINFTEEKLKISLRKYKERHSDAKAGQRVIADLKRGVRPLPSP